MNLREELLKEHSKIQTEKIAHWVAGNATRLKELMHLFLTDEYRVVQRTAWVISVVAEQQPALVQEHLYSIVKRMGEPDIPVAVKRNGVRLLQYVEIPEALHGEVMNICFALLEDIKETVAVRCFSMKILGDLAMIYPEIAPELRILIEDGLEHEPTPGFRSRGQKTLTQLKKIKD